MPVVMQRQALRPSINQGDQARRVHTEFIHRQVCRSPCGDAVTGTSDTDGFEDCESPAGAVHRLSSGRVNNVPQKRIPERIVGQIDDVPVPQTLNEIVEVGKAIKIVLQESIPGRICEQIVDAPRIPLSASDF